MSELPRNPLGFFLTAAALAALAACSSLPDASKTLATVVSPYKIDMVQGNVVTREQLAIIKPGMTRAQVRDVLGTSLLTSMFHEQRWDYIFTLRSQSSQSQSRKVTVFFNGDAVERVEADELPTEAEFVATLKSPARSGTVPLMQASEETLRQYPVPVKPAAPPALPAVNPADYPPLESSVK